jgi:hypothetical protein
MTDTAVEEKVNVPAPVRRFEMADLSQHGPWLMKRFIAKFPDADERYMAGYLSQLIYDNSHMFLYQPHAVALAQIVLSCGIKPVKIVQERFVWVEDRNDKEQIENAADFYSEMKLWGKRQSAERIFACEDTDVPKPLIVARLGRLFDATVSHARI